MDVPLPADLPAPGTILAGKYQVVRVLGAGGMGLVLEARHLRLGQSVAVKLLRPEVRAMPEVTARFEREGRAAARLQSSHVAKVIDVDVLEDGSPFMVMELLRGRELGDELTARGKLPVREVVGYILQACAGMAEAHRMGIVHRDLKPSNLFLVDHEGRRTVKVLDFGISKLAGDVHASVTTTASAFGTPLYMSPEQVRSVKDVDHRADIWSLGVVLYELLAGVPPFTHESATAILAAIIADKPVPIRERRPEVSAALAAVVMRTLEKNPAARYADIRELAAALAPHGPTKDDDTQAPAVTELLAPRDDAPTLHAITGYQDARGAPSRGPSRLGLIAAVSVVLAAVAVVAAFALLRGKPIATPPETPTQPPSSSAPAASAAPLTTAIAAEPLPSAEASAAPSIEPPRPAGTATAKPKATPSTPIPPVKPPVRPSSDDPKYL